MSYDPYDDDVWRWGQPMFGGLPQPAGTGTGAGTAGAGRGLSHRNSRYVPGQRSGTATPSGRWRPYLPGQPVPGAGMFGGGPFSQTPWPNPNPTPGPMTPTPVPGVPAPTVPLPTPPNPTGYGQQAGYGWAPPQWAYAPASSYYYRPPAMPTYQPTMWAPPAQWYNPWGYGYGGW